MPKVENSPARQSQTTRSLLLIWQNPESRKFERVGVLDLLQSGVYTFAYAPNAKTLSSFYPLAEFPDLDKTYVSSSLPAFFANRVMSKERQNYSEYRSWLGLEEGSDTPVEILARSGGGRATDTFHIVESPTSEGRLLSRFFISGVSHVANADSKLASVKSGDKLELRKQPENPVDPHAILVDVASGEEIGWIPNWLLTEVKSHLESGAPVDICVERVNVLAPDHLKLLAQISTSESHS